MALTNMLRGETHREFQNILKEFMPPRDEFKTNVPYPPFSTKYPVLVPCALSQNSLSSTVGTAFDYMARMLVARVTDDDKLRACKDLLAGGGLSDILQEDKSLYLEFKEKYDRSVMDCQKYILGEINEYSKIIPGICFISKLEPIYRRGWKPKDGYATLLTEDISEIVSDVEELCKVFCKVFIESGLVTSKSNVVFNPSFGLWGLRVGGADADICIDGVLYEFKCTKKSGYKAEEMAQLCAYYLLYRLEKEHKKSKEDWIKENVIHSIAFYRPRFGVIEKYDINSMNESKINDTLNKLRTYFNNKRKRYDSSIKE